MMASTVTHGPDRGGLSDPIEAVRRRALEGIATAATPADIRALRSVALTDESLDCRSLACAALAFLIERLPLPAGTPSPEGGGGLEGHRPLLSDPDPAARATAVWRLAAMLDQGVPTLLGMALSRETDAFVLVTLMRALVAVEAAAAPLQIADLAAHPDSRVRTAAVECLAALGPTALAPRLDSFLTDTHPLVQAAARRAAAAAPASSRVAPAAGSRPAPSAAAPDGHGGHQDRGRAPTKIAPPAPDDRRDDARTAAGGIATATAGGEPLERRLCASRVHVRLRALREAVSERRTEALGWIEAAIAKETNPRVRAAMVGALASLGDVRHVDALARSLGDTDARVRATAVEAVGHLDPGRAAKLCAGHLDDASHRVRAAAIVALGRSRPGEALESLRGLAAARGVRARGAACWAAVALGSQAALEVVVAIARGADAPSARRARWALAALAPVLPAAREALHDIAPPPDRAASSRSAPLANDVAGGRPVSEVASPGSPDRPAPSSALAPAADLAVDRLVFELASDAVDDRVAALRGVVRSGDARTIEVIRERMIAQGDSLRRGAAQDAAWTLLDAVRPQAQRTDPLAELAAMVADPLAGADLAASLRPAGPPAAPVEPMQTPGPVLPAPPPSLFLGPHPASAHAPSMPSSASPMPPASTPPAGSTKPALECSPPMPVPSRPASSRSVPTWAPHQAPRGEGASPDAGPTVRAERAGASPGAALLERQFSARRSILIGASMGGLLALAAALLLGRNPATNAQRSVVRSEASARAPAPPGGTPAPLPAPAIVRRTLLGATGARATVQTPEEALRAALSTHRTPTVEDVERSVADALAHRGIHAPELAHVVALDRADRAHEQELSRAREAFARGEPAAAIEILRRALDALPPDHLIGRLEVLRALEAWTRASTAAAGAGGPGGQDNDVWRPQIASIEGKLLALWAQAARESGLSRQQVRAVEEALTVHDSDRIASRRAADFLRPAPIARR